MPDDYRDALQLLISIANDPESPFDYLDESILYQAIGVLKAVEEGEY